MAGPFRKPTRAALFSSRAKERDTGASPDPRTRGEGEKAPFPPLDIDTDSPLI